MKDELWRMKGTKIELRCFVREIHDQAQQWGQTRVGYELRIERDDGELHRSELFRDPNAVKTRSEEFRQILIGRGWTELG